MSKAKAAPRPSISVAYQDGAKAPEKFDKAVFKVEGDERLSDTTVAFGNLRAIFDRNTGFVKKINVAGNELVLKLGFRLYSTKKGKDEHSGAYLFIPDGAAKPYTSGNGTVIRVLEGPLLSEVQVQTEHFLHTARIHKSAGVVGGALEIENEVDMSATRTVMKERQVKVMVNEDGAVVRKAADRKGTLTRKSITQLRPVTAAALKDVDLVMQIEADIDSGDTAFFDLNGYQMTEKQRRADIPTNGQYMPVTLMAFMQSLQQRLTLHTNAAVGVASLRPGHFEVMVGRTHNRDDNLGLGEGIAKDKQTQTKVLLQVERAPTTTAHPSSATVPAPTAAAHALSDALNFAPVVFAAGVDGAAAKKSEEERLGRAVPITAAQLRFDANLHLVHLRSLLSSHAPFASTGRVLVTLHRRAYACLQSTSDCTDLTDPHEVDLAPLLQSLGASSFTETSLTGLMEREASGSTAAAIAVPVMDFASGIVTFASPP